MNERVVLMVKLLSSHIVLPVALTLAAYWIRGDAFLVSVIAQTVVLIVYLAGYWEFLGLRFRKVFLILLEYGLFILLAFRATSAGSIEINTMPVILLSVVEVGLLFALIRILVVRYGKDPHSVEIEFPLRNGTFLITDGGNSKTSRLMNYHYYSPLHRKNHTNNSMLYATDIVKRNNSYPSFLPRENDDYPIFGGTVFSPIDGTVVKVENGVPDNHPYVGEYPYNTGNTVVIRNESLYCLVGHLMMGSIGAHVGEKLSAGEEIAKAGNSGMSERPHIHMQLIRSSSDNFWQGAGVPLAFQGRNHYKNRLIHN